MGDYNVDWEDKSSRKQLKQVIDSFNLAHQSYQFLHYPDKPNL